MASSAQHSGVLPSAPLATFAVDDYTVFAPGWCLRMLTSNDSFHLAQAWTLALYDRYLLPDFPIHMGAASSFSRYPALCHFDYDASESTYRVFALCPAFLTICRAHSVQLFDETSLLAGKTADHIRGVFDGTALRLFSDDCGAVVDVLPPPSNIPGDTASLGNVGASSPRPASTTMEIIVTIGTGVACHILGEYKQRVRALNANPSSTFLTP
ncbi:hypothetical protein DFJ58DRAFT_912068 [Suillus subalutaceus]|uniref:uncharacterized protein n=1 Tax=Suillus subalutaceus TaxID=48586 RepID=UPI001B85C964|nr:uncharacterized protein DFJ58DRAFT_912068 [Suillus subalutaceus]KAG1865015.1 hypothetical protein DFJ58DRAFT_912068 [Suillus subalutaceus]